MTLQSARHAWDLPRTTRPQDCARFGPPPHWKQRSLLAADDEEERRVDEPRSVLDRLDPAPKVLTVGYACSARLGLLDVSWGEAALGDDGRAALVARRAGPPR